MIAVRRRNTVFSAMNDFGSLPHQNPPAMSSKIRSLPPHMYCMAIRITKILIKNRMSTKKGEKLAVSLPYLSVKKGHYEYLCQQVSALKRHHPDAILAASQVQGDTPNTRNTGLSIYVVYTQEANFLFLGVCPMHL